MTRAVTQGTITTQVRFTREEVEKILMDAALAANPDLVMPDFGEGEGDEISIQIRPVGGNADWGRVVDEVELCLVLVDVENDPVAAVEPEA